MVEIGLVEHGSRPAGAGSWIHAPGVGDDFEARLLPEQRGQTLQHIEEIGSETRLAVALLLQRQDRHGQFGEVFEGQIIEPAMLSQDHRSVQVVAPEAAAVADAYGCHARSALAAWHAQGQAASGSITWGRRRAQGHPSWGVEAASTWCDPCPPRPRPAGSAAPNPGLPAAHADCRSW